MVVWGSVENAELVESQVERFALNDFDLSASSHSDGGRSRLVGSPIVILQPAVHIIPLHCIINLHCNQLHNIALYCTILHSAYYCNVQRSPNRILMSCAADPSKSSAQLKIWSIGPPPRGNDYETNFQLKQCV